MVVYRIGPHVIEELGVKTVSLSGVGSSVTVSAHARFVRWLSQPVPATYLGRQYFPGNINYRLSHPKPSWPTSHLLVVPVSAYGRPGLWGSMAMVGNDKEMPTRFALTLDASNFGPFLLAKRVKGDLV